MSIDRDLLTRFIREYPFQPATAFWRAAEIGHVVSQPFPDGFGLDLGCGDGKLTKILMERVGKREWVGIDVDSQEVGGAEGAGIYSRLHICPAHRIPEKDSTFDFCFSNSVVEHIDNIDETIKEVARLLKSGGVFLFTVPQDGFHDCLRGPLWPFVSREDYIKNLDRRLAHKWIWGVTEWQKVLSRHGLKIEESSEYLTKPEVRRWETLSRLTAGLLYMLFGKKKSPMEIQRTFGWRKASRKTPLIITRLLSFLLAFGVREVGSGEPVIYGGLMIRARKT